MKFYLGSHEPTWLAKAHVSLFISAVRLRERCKKKLPRARVPWALDSGGFSVIKGPSGYPQSAEVYAAEVRRWSECIGNLEWAAIQDWMCEKEKLALTGFTVEEHQRRTVQSWIDLRRIAPDLPWIPVLQGFTLAEYQRCAAMYADAGTDLLALPTVGIGSICRREHTDEAEGIIREMAGKGLKLHGFGFKLDGLERCADVLASADSLAWSDAARHRSNAAKKDQRVTCAMITGEKSPQNSPRVALRWLSDIEYRAGSKDAPELVHPCPWCGSDDVYPPAHDPGYVCVSCGESWCQDGPMLTDPPTRKPVKKPKKKRAAKAA